MDAADIAAENQQRHIDNAIATSGDDRQGPTKCRKCGDRDERIEAGYAICQSCFEDMQGEAS